MGFRAFYLAGDYKIGHVIFLSSAALAAWHIWREQERQLPNPAMDQMQGAYLGPEFAADDILRVARRHRAWRRLAQARLEALRQSVRKI